MHAAALPAGRPQDLLALYDTHVLPSSGRCRLLSTELWGGLAQPPQDDDGELQQPAQLQQLGAEAAAAKAHEAHVPAAAGGGGGGARSVGWRAVRDGGVTALHAELPHYCHSQTVGALRPVPAELCRGAAAAVVSAAEA